VHNPAARGDDRDDRLIEEGEYPPWGRQGDLARLAEDGELAGTGAQRVQQLDGLVAAVGGG